MDKRIVIDVLFGDEIKKMECYEDSSHNFSVLKNGDWALENLQVLTAHLMGQLARNAVKEQELHKKLIDLLDGTIKDNKLINVLLTQLVLFERMIGEDIFHDASAEVLALWVAKQVPKVDIEDGEYAYIVNNFNLLESVAAFLKIQRARAGRDGVIKGRHQVSQAAKDWVVVRKWHDLREACKPIPSGKTHHKDTDFARDVINTTGVELKEKTITDMMRKWRKEAKQGKKPS
jgi:hypothetical protein